MQPLHICVLGHWVIRACRKENRENVVLLIQTPFCKSSQRNALVLLPRSAFATPSASPKSPGIPQMRRLFFWTMPSLSRRLLGPLAVCLATEGGIFHSVTSPESAAFFSSCFIDTGGSGSLRCVWQRFYRENIDASARRMLICTRGFVFPYGAPLQNWFLFRPRWCSDLAACISFVSPRFWHESAVLHKRGDNAAVKTDVETLHNNTMLELTKVVLNLAVHSSTLSFTVITACQCHLKIALCHPFWRRRRQPSRSPRLDAPAGFDAAVHTKQSMWEKVCHHVKTPRFTHKLK